jgi:predicted nucleic acid-binding Zn ribbon protein
MAGKPKPIGNILSELLARRGYARVIAAGVSAEAWRQAAGEALAQHSRAGQSRRGVLEVFVANSTLAQELSFEKQAILTRLHTLQPDEAIRDLKIRVGPLA